MLGKRIEDVVQGWQRDRAADPGREQARRAGPGRDRAGRVRRPRALDLGLGRRLRGGHGLRVPRPDRGARARGDEGGLRRHRLARAAHAARRDLRLGADDPAHGHRARPGDPGPAARRDRLRVRPARDDRQRPARRGPPRRRPDAGHDRELRSGRAGRRRSSRRLGRTSRRRSSSSCGAPKQVHERRRRPGPAPPGAREPRRQRDQVLARGRPRRALGRERRRRDPLLGRGPRPRHPGRRAPPDLREVLPPRSGHDARDRRHRARPLHLPRARPPDGREDLGRVEARRGLDLRRRASAAAERRRRRSAKAPAKTG